MKIRLLFIIRCGATAEACLWAVVLLFCACAGGGKSPVGQADAFAVKPLEIYVAVDPDSIESDSGPTAGAVAASGCPEGDAAWDLLYRPGAEAPGYGMYTYVLFGKPPPEKSGFFPETLERYAAAVRAAVTETGSDEPAPARDQANILYLLVKKNPVAGPLSIDDYNSELSAEIISGLFRWMRQGDAWPPRLLSRPGPFLLVSARPLGRLQRATGPFLLVDLSVAEAAAVSGVMNTLHQPVGRKPENEMLLFSSLRLKLFHFLDAPGENLVIFGAGAGYFRSDTEPSKRAK